MEALWCREVGLSPLLLAVQWHAGLPQGKNPQISPSDRACGLKRNAYIETGHCHSSTIQLVPNKRSYSWWDSKASKVRLNHVQDHDSKGIWAQRSRTSNSSQMAGLAGHRPTHFIAFPSNHHTSLDRKWRRQHLDRLAKRTAWWTKIRHVPLGITLKNTVEELMRDSQYYLLNRILVMSSNSDSKLLLTSYNKKDCFLSTSQTLFYQRNVFIGLTSHPIGPVSHHCWSTSNWTKLGEGHGTLVIRHVSRDSLEFVNKHPLTIQPTCGEKHIRYLFFLFERRQSLQGFWTFTLLLLEVATPSSSFLPAFW